MRIKSIDHYLKLIGKKLEALRLQMGYETIKEFVGDFNLAIIHYWRIEKGKANITLGTLNRLLKIHRIDMRQFFCDLETV